MEPFVRVNLTAQLLEELWKFVEQRGNLLGHISQIMKSLNAAEGAEPNDTDMTISKPLSKIINKVAKEERPAFPPHMNTCEKH